MSDANRYPKVPNEDDDRARLEAEFPEVVGALRDLASAQHVLPVNDHIEHETSPVCVCGPALITFPEGMVAVHSSLDGRESEEQS